MNYYEHHLGDYLRDTAHLSMIEDGAYRRLIDAYYIAEGPFPDDKRELMKLCRAVTKPEREAVEYVLKKFFVYEAGSGWLHKRCDREIARYKAKQEKARASADARWNAQRGHSERNANASTEHDAQHMRTHSERNANGMHRAPVPSHQSPDLIQCISDEPDGSSSSPQPTTSPTPALPQCPYDEIVAAYHQALPMLPQVRLMDEKRKTLMRKRWAWVFRSKKADGSRRASNSTEAVEWLRSYFARAALNAWLTGQQPSRTHPDWKADLDFLLKDAGLKAVIERTEVPA